MERHKVEELFDATRPPPDADPHKRLEYGYLEYARSIITTHVRRELSIAEFAIELSPFTLDDKNRNFIAYCNWQEKNKCFQIFYRIQDERCKERIAIAEALGMIVLEFAPKLLNQPSLMSNGDQLPLTYFAKKLLEFSANNDNGSFLRKQYTLSTENIIKKIQLLHPGYSEELLAAPHKTVIDAEFKRIFTDSSDLNSVSALLNSDKKLITKYIQGKEPLSVDGAQKKLAIEITPSYGATRIIGMLYCHQEGCDIWYPTVEQIRGARRIANAAKINELAVIRLIVAHELGHIICHRIPGFVGPIGGTKPSTTQEEKEATYFARLLLERRELLYNDMKRDEKFDKACLEINQLIRQVYNTRGEDWLNWVLD